MSKLFIAYGTRLADMTEALLDEAGTADRLKPTMRVGIKPNLVVSRPASEGATTHPEIVEGIVRFLQRVGISDITILEGAWVGDNTQRAFSVCGYEDMAKRYGIQLHDTKRDKGVAMQTCGMSVQVCESVLTLDYLINVPVLKAHCQTSMTCCLKNMKGVIPDSEKRRFHTLGLDKPIAALNVAVTPQLHIVDSVCGDLTFEEGGNPVTANRVLLGEDAVLLDSYCARLIGYSPDEIGHLLLAKQAGVGQYADERTDVVELFADQRPAAPASASHRARQLGAAVAADSACSACYAALIHALDKLGGYRGAPISIGQGYRGQQPGGLGIGNCCKGCAQYVQGCPPSAKDIVDFLRER